MISESSVKKFCKESITLIENYEQAIADSRTWECHHKAEILSCGQFSRETLKKYNLYWYRPATELIFLTKFEHRRLHNRNLRDETRQKMSEVKKGENNPMFGKHLTGENAPMFGKHHSEKTRQKLSETLKKLLSNPENNPAFGKIWITNGEINTRIDKNLPIPEGWQRGRK